MNTPPELDAFAEDVRAAIADFAAQAREALVAHRADFPRYAMVHTGPNRAQRRAAASPRRREPAVNPAIAAQLAARHASSRVGGEEIAE